MIRKMVIGNWKMNGVVSDLAEIGRIEDGLDDDADVDVALCPPFTLMASAARRCHRLWIGGQDCHFASAGAFTGSVSAGMLRDSGARLVIVGHSERRAGLGETCQQIGMKIAAAQEVGLLVVLCVGETDVARSSGRAVEVVLGQLEESLPDRADPEALVVAYEPVWAIGSGRLPSSEEIAEMHAALRSRLSERLQGGNGVRILYGGSVKAGETAQVMRIAGVDGVLVGGASLRSIDFLGIVDAARGSPRAI